MKRLKSVINTSFSFDENLNTFISGDFYFIEEKEIDLFDKDGNFFMKHIISDTSVESNKTELLEKNFENKIVIGAFQRGFDFFVLKTLDINTHEKLSSYPWEKLGCTISYCTYDIHLYKKNIREQESTTKIMATTGSYRYAVFQDLGKEILNFDYLKYRDNYQKFIEKNPLLEQDAKRVFEYNLHCLSDYFLCSIEHLISSNFSIKTQMIKKFMYKIKQKK